LFRKAPQSPSNELVIPCADGKSLRYEGDSTFVIRTQTGYKRKNYFVRITFMSMRYLIRRPKPEDLTEVKQRVKDLDTQLGKPGADFKRIISVSFSPLRSAHYQFSTRKVGADWIWVSPCIELDGEDEKGLFALTDLYHVPRPAHLTNL
jgi:hypothetical protein